MRASVFIATSLDGFIARDDGAIDWLPAVGKNGEDYGYARFMATVDAMVIGRRTYELARGFEPWPYGSTPVVVLSRSPVAVPQGLSGTVEAMSCSPAEVLERLSGRGLRHAYVDGGRTIQGFLEAGLVDELVITRIPILIGTGIPLFGPLARDIRLRHVQTRSFADGLVQSRYEVPREG